MLYPDAVSTALLVIDMQEKLVPVMQRSEECVNRMRLLLQVAALLEMDAIVTEHCSDKIGKTVPAIGELFSPTWPIVEKKSFSCFGNSDFRATLGRKKRRGLIVCGIESHVCVFQTVADAIEAGYQVLVAADAIASRSTRDMEPACQAMRDIGATLLSSESIVFMLLKSADHPQFRPVAKLVK